MGQHQGLLFDNYTEFVKKIDAFCRDSAECYGNKLVCARGCHTCCLHLSLFPVEAVYIRLALENLDDPAFRKIQSRAMALLDQPEGECPLLDGGECLLYSVRPVICRTHGLPVRVRTETGQRVDHCPMNFTSGARPDPKHTLDLEQLNTTLVAINRLFIRQGMVEDSFPERLALAEALLMDLDG